MPPSEVTKSDAQRPQGAGGRLLYHGPVTVLFSSWLAKNLYYAQNPIACSTPLSFWGRTDGAKLALWPAAVEISLGCPITTFSIWWTFSTPPLGPFFQKRRFFNSHACFRHGDSGGRFIESLFPTSRKEREKWAPGGRCRFCFNRDCPRHRGLREPHQETLCQKSPYQALSHKHPHKPVKSGLAVPDRFAGPAHEEPAAVRPGLSVTSLSPNFIWRVAHLSAFGQ